MTNTDKTLDEKVAVITGGSRGIGKAVAAALIERGARVVIGDVLEVEGGATVQEFNAAAGRKVAAFIRTDVTKYGDNIALFQLAEKEFGGVDIAFLNAGIGGRAADVALLPIDEELDERAMSVNGISVMKGTKVAILHMAKRGGGVIVNTASILGLRSLPTTSSYGASKHAVVGWTRSFNLLPSICNVRVNAVCPHFVDTDIIAVNSERKAQGSPMTELIPKINKAKIGTVVKAVLMLIEDQQRNAQTVLALPDDVIKVDEPPPCFLTEGVTPEFQQEYKQYEADYTTYYRKVLDYSLSVYNEKYPQQ
ncbi:hypothetical protein BJV82DRAFT_606184 [Fennellomyces sp. T-0311]|nr:hypothetical protein BJV82DRAFT_606184 [Fennellomyces sp. T-0311]